MTENEIKKIVSYTVDDLLDKSMIVKDDELSYQFMSRRLIRHYTQAADEKITNTLLGLKNDPYYDVIPLFYKNNKTITAISVTLHCDRATVSRNKKRLVLELYKKCYDN